MLKKTILVETKANNSKHGTKSEPKSKMIDLYPLLLLSLTKKTTTELGKNTSAVSRPCYEIFAFKPGK